MTINHTTKGEIILKKIKSYTSIWSVEKVIYAINDFNLPFPVSFTQMAWFILSLFFVMMFANLPPLSLIQGALVKYIAVPIGITFFMSQKTFDDKKPYSFLKSVLAYTLRPKTTFMGKAVKVNKDIVAKKKINEQITVVKSKIIRLSDFKHKDKIQGIQDKDDESKRKNNNNVNVKIKETTKAGGTR